MLVVWGGGRQDDVEDLGSTSVYSGGSVYDPTEVEALRRALLAWYDANQRSLPWRTRYTPDADPGKDVGYGVWVSEIMLQQTRLEDSVRAELNAPACDPFYTCRVETVIDYYNRWMQKWPTVDDLAKAQLEVHHTVSNVF